MTAQKKQYILEGLCCGNCAAKIEKDIRLLDGVKSATVNFATKSLLVEFETDADELTKVITHIAVSHDEDIIVKGA